MASLLPAQGPYRFSQQQIIGINHHFARVADGIFDEDDVRLLLIYLREFLINGDNIARVAHGNAGILREIGHAIAHTVRDRGELHRSIREVVRDLAAPDGVDKLAKTKFVLFDSDAIIDGLKGVLLSSDVIYDPNKIESAFHRHAGDLKICLVAMLHGLIFKISYPGSQEDFHVFDSAQEHVVHVRTELDLSNVESLHQLRVNARIPVYGGLIYSQCIMMCKELKLESVNVDALHRTGSREGFLEGVKASREDSQLIVRRVNEGVTSTDILAVFRRCSYDTEPISRGVELRKVLP